MITLQEHDAIKRAVKAHFEHLWTLIVAGREDSTALDAAEGYLGELKTASPIEYGVVIKMIEKATGLDWAAITGDQKS